MIRARATGTAATRSGRRATPSRLGGVAAGIALLAGGLVSGCGDDGGGPPDLGSGGATLGDEAARGRQVAEDRGCTSCHTADGGTGTGPTWAGIWGTEVDLEDGTTAVVDEAYVTRSVREPDAQVVDGYLDIMPTVELSDEELASVAAYIEALG